ncbi:hypothetical protein [Bacillus sp. Marseille-P3661]|uniref:hypothetical protein n=1 Tax=Bacillus sp. Marseille-P3661 TaxID=1936234 RepID=UPI000C848E36|nr:hypothetical protein [Bacillus sp. Marseille-P3661]
MLNKQVLREMQEYVHNHLYSINEVCETIHYNEDIILQNIQPIELETFIKKNQKPTLKQVLFNLIDKKENTDAEVYKKAGIDRKLFSKIRSNPTYRPGKNTIIALALALEVNKADMDQLLSSAGYSLSDSETYDLIVQFCIEKKIYDIDDVNEALEYFNLKPLNGVTK